MRQSTYGFIWPLVWIFHKLQVNENKDSALESESQVSHNSTEKIEIRFYLLIVSDCFDLKKEMYQGRIE